MTEQINAEDRILEEDCPFLEIREVHSEAEIGEKFSLENCELWQ
jgi:hypothetical protein